MISSPREDEARAASGLHDVPTVLPKSLMLALTNRTPEPPAGGPGTPWPLDEDYWLRHCEGFRVDSGAGRLGVVESVGPGARADRPDVVAVRSGGLRPRTTIVSVGDIVEVRPAERRLIIRP